MTVRAVNEMMKRMNEWAVKNSYVQCAGCLGYGKASDMRWKNAEQYAVFPFCTDACFTESRWKHE